MSDIELSDATVFSFDHDGTDERLQAVTEAVHRPLPFYKGDDVTFEAKLDHGWSSVEGAAIDLAWLSNQPGVENTELRLYVSDAFYDNHLKIEALNGVARVHQGHISYEKIEFITVENKGDGASKIDGYRWVSKNNYVKLYAREIEDLLSDCEIDDYLIFIVRSGDHGPELVVRIVDDGSNAYAEEIAAEQNVGEKDYWQTVRAYASGELKSVQDVVDELGGYDWWLGMDDWPDVNMPYKIVVNLE